MQLSLTDGAIGEAACVSVHGANRLGTTLLLDIVVFAGGGAQGGGNGNTGCCCARVAEAATEKALDRFDRMRNARGSESAASIRLEMQYMMGVTLLFSDPATALPMA